jgi:hypothetical protein
MYLNVPTKVAHIAIEFCNSADKPKSDNLTSPTREKKRRREEEEKKRERREKREKSENSITFLLLFFKVFFLLLLLLTLRVDQNIGWFNITMDTF